MKNYISQNQERFLSELFELLRIPSVSADSKCKDDVLRAADFIADRLRELGLDKVNIYPTDGFPIVYGEYIFDQNLPTVLVYGHYDVQPPDPLELWDNDPFDPVIKNEKIYARGACDDKGQMYMHIKAFETMKATSGVPCNVKFMIEGEEEIGSDNLEIFVRNNKSLLEADAVLVSDTGILSNDVPSLTTGLRGMSYMEVEVTGPDRDLHSGMYGGAVPNPINVLCDMISALHNEKGEVNIPGFYDKVEELRQQDRDELNEAPFSEEEFKKEISLSGVMGEKGYNTRERMSIRPTLDVNGIWGGYIGEGAKTVIPSKAHAKISMRLVPNQVSKEITDLFENHFKSIAPSSVSVKVTPHHGAEPAVTPTDSDGYIAASKAFEEVWGKKPVPTRDGGSIPIVALFESELNIKTILLGFGLDEDAIHSPNESYGLFNYFMGIETICAFYNHYVNLKK